MSAGGCARSGCRCWSPAAGTTRRGPPHAGLADGYPGAELVIFENSSHMAFVEERAAFVDRARAFLRQHDATQKIAR